MYALSNVFHDLASELYACLQHVLALHTAFVLQMTDKRICLLPVQTSEQHSNRFLSLCMLEAFHSHSEPGRGLYDKAPTASVACDP